MSPVEPTDAPTGAQDGPIDDLAPPVARRRTSGRRPAAPRVEPQRIGVATFNQYVQLTPEESIEDALDLTSRPAVSIVGWQEGFVNGPVYQRLAQEGWATKRYVAAKGSRELAVSWRTDRFALVGSALHKLADGVAEGDGLYPFGTRYVLRVTLRDRATGKRISVLDTHLPQRIEDLDDPGTFRSTKNALRAHRQLERLPRSGSRRPGAGWSAPATTTSPPSPTSGRATGWRRPGLRRRRAVVVLRARLRGALGRRTPAAGGSSTTCTSPRPRCADGRIAWRRQRTPRRAPQRPPAAVVRRACPEPRVGATRVVAGPGRPAGAPATGPRAPDGGRRASARAARGPLEQPRPPRG